MSSWFSGRGKQANKSKEGPTVGLSNPNLFLDEGAQGFTHVDDAGVDKGIFSLTDIRTDTRQADRGGSRIIALPKNRYQKPPQVSCLNGTDSKGPDKRAISWQKA